MTRVVVTGLGILAPTGNSVKEAWDNAVNAVSGIAPITLVDREKLSVTIGGEVKDFNPEAYMDPKEARRSSRFVQLAVGAAAEALLQANIPKTEEYAEHFGVSIGVGIGALSLIEESAVVFHAKGNQRVSPFLIPYCIANMAAGMVSMRYNLQGPNICPTTACTSGTHGIGEAYLLI